MKRCIVVTYKNGSSINIDVPELYYQEKYKNKSDSRLHKIFLNEYQKFVTAMNKGTDVVLVGKYLKFSNTSVCGKDVLGIDIKDLEEEVKPQDNTVYVPGVNDRVFLDISKTQLEDLIQKLNNTDLIDNLDKLVQKMVSYFSKANVEFTIKAGKKPSTSGTTGRKKKVAVVEEVPSVDESSASLEQSPPENSTPISRS